MPSPFPGMDPYLELPRVWHQFHGEFIFKVRKYVFDGLPPGYVAEVDRHVYVTDAADGDRVSIGQPDGFVSRDDATDAPAGGTAVMPPGVVLLPRVRRESGRYVKIVDERDRRVVAVIEILSPSNKYAGKDRDAYLAKRDEYLAAGVNLVEIDLLRGGQRMPVDVPPAGDYLVLVSRAEDYPRAGVWPTGVRDPLPEVPVPLGKGLADVVLDLARPFRDAYDDGHYDRLVDYAGPPTPRLNKADAAWARDLLAAWRGNGPKPPRRRAES